MGSLSEMPEDVIYRISSFLTNKELARVSVLSKEYWKLMRKRPTLVYDCIKTYIRDPNRARTLDRYRKEVRSIHSSLVRYCEQNIDLQTFTFRADWWRCSLLPAEDFELYDNCIRLALQKGVRNLNLSMWSDYVLHVPEVMEPLVRFNAMYCRLQLEGCVRWPNLKHLSLVHVVLASEAVFDSIIRGCPLLEILEMDFFNCEGEMVNLNFRVGNLRCLRKVKAGLGRTHSFEVTGAPSLEYLLCRFRNSTLNWIRQSEQYPNLTRLSLFNVMIREDFFLHMEHIVPKLEDLSIECNDSLQRIKLSSRTLKKINLAYISQLQEAEFDVPSIAVFKFRLRYKDRMPKCCFTGKSDRWVSHLRILCRAHINTEWFIELKDMILTAIKGSEAYLSIDFFGKVKFDLPNHESMSLSGIPEIQDLYLNSVHERNYSSSSLYPALDGMFWICRPRTIAFMNWDFYDYESPRLMHDFLLPATTTTHLSKSHRSCDQCVWRVTGIKLFRLAKFQYWQNPNSVDSYLLKEEQGLELLPGASDCNRFLELLKVYVKNDMNISKFYLEWRVCGTHSSRILLPSPSTSSF